MNEVRLFTKRAIICEVYMQQNDCYIAGSKGALAKCI